MPGHVTAAESAADLERHGGKTGGSIGRVSAEAAAVLVCATLGTGAGKKGHRPTIPEIAARQAMPLRC